VAPQVADNTPAPPTEKKVNEMNDKHDKHSDAGSSRQKSAALAETATERIRELNDKFRRTHQGGKVLVTAGVAALGPERVRAILRLVTEFNAFTPDNDPYGEHDFGNFEDGGERFFFKIDYYDQHLEHGSEDPADPNRTCRVLTVMLAFLAHRRHPGRLSE
jgi:Protein of unknown function (DUF3768)